MKKAILFSLISIFGLNLSAQTKWKKYPDNPVMQSGRADEWDKLLNSPSTVIYKDSSYHMWYWGGDYNKQRYPIGYAASPDGINWTKDTLNNPVLKPGPEGAWDDFAIRTPSVLFIDSTYHMWYSGYMDPDNCRIGHAISKNGIDWTKDTLNNPVLDIGSSGSWDDKIVGDVAVIHDGSKFHMFYAGGRTYDMTPFGHATSLDGSNWTRDSLNPVLESGLIGEERGIEWLTAIYDGSGFHLWYHSGDVARWAINYATSLDGSHWIKDNHNPVFKGTPGSWDANSIMGTAIIDSAHVKFKMWYGGYSTNSIYTDIGYAESRASGWKPLKSMAIAKGASASAVIDNKIYVFGGMDKSTASLNSAEVYNTETDEWSDIAPVPVDLSYTNAGHINDKIYLAGGWRHPGSGWITIDSTFEYDPVLDSWEAKKECPKKSGDNAFCVLNGKLYLFGGLKDFPNLDNSGQKDALVYDPGSDTWDALPDMLNARGDAATAIVYDGKIYVFGGLAAVSDTESLIVGKPERYDPGENTWTELADMPVPVTGHMSLVYKDKIYIFGGDYSVNFNSNPSTAYCTNVIQEYDPLTNQWQLMAPMPFKRSAMTGQKVGNYAYLMGGYPENSRDFDSVLPDVWGFNLEALQEGCDEVMILDPSKSLVIGDTYMLQAEVLPSEFANKTITWLSDNEAVVTVSEEGIVSCMGAGTATISAKLKYGGCSDSYVITVNEPAWMLMNSLDPGGITCIVDSMIYSFASGGEGWIIGDDVNSYNTSTNEWSELSPSPMPITEGGIGLVGDKIYLVGGYENENLDDWVTTDSILEYDPSLDSWVFKTKCPLKIASSAYCVMNDEIYIFGGLGDPWQDVSYPYEAWTYNPVNELWNSLPDMQYPHLMHGTAEVLDGNIYLLGGVGLAPDYSPPRSEKFDGEKWEPIAEMPVPVTLHKSIVHNNKILVFGGDSVWTMAKSYSTNFIQEYDPATDSWKLLEPMPFQRSGMFGGKVGNYVYLMGGTIDTRDPFEAVSDVWRFNLDSLKEWVALCNEVSINHSFLKMEVDDTNTLSAGVLPTYVADRTISWSSSDEGVATVSTEGIVSAVSKGLVTITATANGGGCTASCELTVGNVGVEVSHARQIDIFPNPVSNILNIEAGSLEMYQIRITSLNGQEIYSGEMEGSTHQIDLSSFQKGVYFITIKSKDFVTTRKIIKL